MINISGFKNNQTKLRKSTEALAKHLGVNCGITLRKIDHVTKNTYGFAAEILGSQHICIMKDCPDSMLPTIIAHEMVHVHQMFRGDLIFDYDNMIFTWKGKKYFKEDLDLMEYYDRPWEAEAKKLEKKLAQDFFMS